MTDQSLSRTLSDSSPGSTAAPVPIAGTAASLDDASPTIEMAAAPNAPAVETDADPAGAPAAAPLAAYGVSTPLAAPRCPWCSADLPAGTIDRCPACGANLTPEGDPSIPGVTEVIGQASRALPTEPARRSSRLLSWISGDIEPDPVPINAGDNAQLEALAPPPLEVRREMLRLQLEAEGFVITDDEPADNAVAATDAAEPATLATLDAEPAATAPAAAPAAPIQADAPTMPDAVVSAQPSSDQAPTQLHG